MWYFLCNYYRKCIKQKEGKGMRKAESDKIKKLYISNEKF